MSLKMIELAWGDVEYKAMLSGDESKRQSAKRHLIRLEQMYCHRFYKARLK